MRSEILLLLSLTACGQMFAQDPAIASGGTINGASFQVGQAVAAGSLVSIFGSNLASSVQSADSIPLSTSLGGATVTFQSDSASFTAPLLFAQPGTSSQINAQVPWELTPAAGETQTVNVVVTRDGVASAASPVTLTTAAPGLFAFGTNAVAVNNSDGTLAWATGAVAGVNSHPAKAGDFLILYATGLGPVDSSIEDGHNSLDKLRNTVTLPTVLIGGVPATVLFSGLSPQFVGVNQLNIQVAEGTPVGTVPIQIQMNGITSPNTITMAVSQ